MASTGSRSARQYGFAVFATAAVVLVRLAAVAALGAESRFLTLLIAPLFSAWYGGFRAGLLATALASLASAYFFSPQHPWQLDMAAWLNVAAFAVEGALISAIAATRDRAKNSAIDANRAAGEILESITDAFAALDANFRFTYVNSAAERGLRHKSKELIGTTVWDLFPFLSGTDLAAQARRVITERVSMQTEYLYPPLDRWVEIRAFPGKDGGLSVYFRDVTRRHRAKEQLEQMAAIVEHSQDGIISTSLNGVILTWNAAAERIYGYSAAEMIGRLPHMLVPGDRPNEIAELHARVARGEHIDHWESLRLRKDGVIVPVSVSLSPIRDSSGTIWAISIVSRDITERRRQEAALRKWEYVFRNTGWGIVLTNPSGTTMESVNPAFARMHGYQAEEVAGRSLTDMLAPESQVEFPKHLAAAGERGQVVYEALHLHRDGTYFPVLTDQTVIYDPQGGLAFRAYYFRDITDRKRLEAKVREAQKLESLGVLAGGLAHDFNNLLTGIMGNAGLVLESLGPDNPARPPLINVVRASERAADLTRQMLAYSGQGRFVLQKIDLSNLTREIMELIRSSVSRKVQLDLRLADNLPAIEGDPGQIQQLIMNLVINGAEAAGDQIGLVRVETSIREISAVELHKYQGNSAIAPGRYVNLSVADTGSGMDEQTKARIFDPFYTTKFTGRGLGLAAVSGIVRSHHGAIKVESAPGAGSTFAVIFPEAPGSSPEPAPTCEQNQNLQGNALILVVDDEEMVRRTARASLEHYGYRIAVAGDGSEAIDIFKRRASEIALVLLDLTMPVLSGEETLERLRSMRPDVKVIVSSGYNEAETIRRFCRTGVTRFIQKPYTPARLAEAVKDVLR